MISAIVFDMDGVLFDTETVSIKSWRKIAPEFGIEDITPAHTACIGVNRNDGIRVLKDHFGEDFDAIGFLERAHVVFNETISQELPLMKGVREILDFLKEKKVPAAICSSTRVPVILEHLEQTGLTHYFDQIIGGDMVEHSKPLPDIYLKACEALGFAPEVCVGVEDSPNGVRSSSSAGLQTVMIPDLVPCTEELRNRCVLVAEDLLELKDYLAEKLAE